MRAVSFRLTYDSGVDPVADAFRDHRELYAHSLACTVGPEYCWRVDRVTGSSDGLAAADAAFGRACHGADCLGSDECGAETATETLHRDPSTRILFSSWRRTDECRSVPHLALEYLGRGVLFATERHGRRYDWNVLMPADADLGGLSTAIGDAAGDRVRFDLLQVTDESAWLSAYSGRPALPYDHHEVLAAAVEAGYYETPRDITVEALAEELDVPRSTLSYRLRRAEAELVKHFVGTER